MAYFLLTIVMMFFLVSCSPIKSDSLKPGAASDIKAKTEVQTADVSFDAESGEVKYTLPEPALVRIRIGVRDGGPLLTHLLDWEYRDKGEHKEIWDGKIQGSEADLRGRGDLMVVFKAVPASTDKESDFLRRAPQLTIDFLESKGSDEQGLPIISGRVPLRTTINSKDDVWLSNTRYETGIYIDHLFLTEEEEGINPFSYYLDTEKFSNGPHIITVSVTSYGGTAGTQSARVLIKNEAVYE